MTVPGYQSFMVAMMTAPDGKLVNADVKKLAEKYGVKQDWASMALSHWLRRA